MSVLKGERKTFFNGFYPEGHIAIEVRAQTLSLVSRAVTERSGLHVALENDVIPLYYERNSHGIPRGWVARMKNAIRSLAWRFNANRMVMQYASECYLPLAGLIPDSWDERVGARPR